MSTLDDWAKAYARQAQADFDTWTRLQAEVQVPSCQRLMFLQMACEKLSKAHLCVHGTQAGDLQKSHAYIAKNLPIILRGLITSGFKVRNPIWTLVNAKHLAQEIELLAPAIKRGGQRPDNCEYPWEDTAGGLHSPLDWTFVPAHLLLSPAGRTFLKLVRAAITAFL